MDFDEIKLLFAQEQVRVNDDNLHHLIQLIDKNNDGVIDWEEFEDAFDEIESIDEFCFVTFDFHINNFVCTLCTDW